MVVARERAQRGVADPVHDLHRGSAFREPEPLAGEDVSVALGVQGGEALGEFDFLAIHGDGAVGALRPQGVRSRPVASSPSGEILLPRLFPGGDEEYRTEPGADESQRIRRTVPQESRQ